MDNVTDTIIKLVSDKFEISRAKLSEGTQFSEIGADSLDLVDLVTELEGKYSVQVPDDAIDRMKTIGDVADYILQSGGGR